MVVNKKLNENITSAIEIKDFVAGKNAQVWILSGPGIDATNEKGQTTVRVKHTVCRTASSEQEKVSSFLFTFEPHSLTAIEIREEATLSPE